MDNNEIKKYIVRIIYKDYKDSIGSGVIIPLSTTQEYFYVFTAKHTFFDKDIERDISNIENKITIENQYIGKINVTKNDIQPDIDKEYDLLIFRIQVKLNPKIKDLKPLSIFSDDFRNCTVMGYPKARMNKDTKYDAFACTYKQQNEKPYIFEMYSNKRLAEERAIDLNPNSTMQGVSGSGVFVKGSTEELYLVGIQIQSAPNDALIAIDLREIFDKLNTKLGNSLTLGGYQFFEEIGLDIKKLEFDNLLDKLNNDNKISRIKKHNGFDSEIDFLEQPNYRDKMNDKYKNLKEKMKELSDTFLYQGIIFHKNSKHQQATNRFKKAIILYPEYKHYFSKAKFERNELTNNQIEAKKKIDKESIFSDDINIVIDTFKSDIKKYKEEKENKNLIEAYRQIIPLLSIEYDNNKSEIIKFQKELARTLIIENQLQEAENILLNIEDTDVNSDLYQIYTDENFIKDSGLNKKQFSNKLIDFLGRLNRESNEYENIKKRLEELNIFDNQMIEFHEKFVNLENKYEKTIEKLTNDIQLLSNNISDKTLLNKINYQVFNTDKKLDTVSINLSHKIDGYSDNVDKKLDIIIGTIKKTNNKKIDNVLESICNSNRALVTKIQTMYHQNDRVNNKAKTALKKSIDEMNEKLKTFQNVNQIEKIIKDSNWNFYQSIKGLCESEQDSYNRKLLEMSIAFTKREHELHIENLENIIDEKNREVLSINLQLTKANEWIDELNKKYKSQSVKSEEVEIKVNQLREMNKILEETISTSENSGKDLINLEKYKLKIKQLEELIFSLKGRNEELEKENKHELETYLQRIEEKYEELGREKKILLENNFSEILKDINSSIDTPSSEPLDTEAFEKIYLALEKLDTKLDDIEDNYELKIDNLNERFTKLISNPKNEKRLRRISRQIHGFENKLEEIKREKRGNPKITLHLLEYDLKKIESIMNKRRLPVYRLYCLVRSVLVGGILLGTSIIIFLNEPYKTWISEIEFSKIVTIFKDVP